MGMVEADDAVLLGAGGAVHFDQLARVDLKPVSRAVVARVDGRDGLGDGDGVAIVGAEQEAAAFVGVVLFGVGADSLVVCEG